MSLFRKLEKRLPNRFKIGCRESSKKLRKNPRFRISSELIIMILVTNLLSLLCSINWRSKDWLLVLRFERGFICSMVASLLSKFSTSHLKYFNIIIFQAFFQKLSKVDNFFFVIFGHQSLKLSEKFAIILNEMRKWKDSFEETTIHRLFYGILSV